MDERDEGLFIDEELPFRERVRMPLLILAVALFSLFGFRLAARLIPDASLAYGISYLGYLVPLCLSCGYKNEPRIRVFTRSPRATVLLPLFSLLFLAVGGISLLGNLLGQGAEAITFQPSMLFFNALLPSVTEELFFRLLCLSLLLPLGRRGAIFLSSLLFATLHTGLVGFLYAFLAGVILASVAVTCGSVGCSVLFHLSINLLSLLLSALPSSVACVLFAILAMAALIGVIFGRRAIWQHFRDATADATVWDAPSLSAVLWSPFGIALFLFILQFFL